MILMILKKFHLVLDGHAGLHREIQNIRQKLREEIGMVNVDVEVIGQKMDAVAEDLVAHHADIEIHRGLYMLKK
jgi:hypothetical protein